MIVVINVLLAIASLLTLATVPVVIGLHPLRGDDAIAVFLFFLLLTPRWILLAAALSAAASRRAFTWIAPTAGRQFASVIGVHLLAGIASISAMVMGAGEHSAAFKPWTLVLSVLVPAAVIAATFVSVSQKANGSTLSPLPWRIGAGALLMVVAAGGARIWWIDRIDRLESMASRAESDARQQQWMQSQRDKFSALPVDAPLESYLPWLGLSIDELRDPALKRVRARPHLNDDVAQMLRSEHAVDALQFMWLWMPDPPDELAGPVHDAIATLPAWAKHTLDSPAERSQISSPESPDDNAPFPPPDPPDLWEISQATVVLASRYKASGLDFRTPIQQLISVLESRRLPDDEFAADVTYQPRGYLEGWLKQNGE